MKGYKVFKSDWTCRGKQYTIGEVATQDGKLKMCRNGIHFCTELADCFYYYDADPRNRLAEVEAVGPVLRSNDDSKCCTRKLRIVKELSIAEFLKDKNFCLEVVKRSPKQIRFMKGMEPGFYLTAMQKTNLLFVHMPEDMKTPELCLAAVQRSGLALKDVPETMKTSDICMTAVQKCGLALEYVPETVKTPEICLAAVKQGGLALRFVPEDLKTEELCLAAVQQDGQALEYVTDQTPEICRAAVRQNRSLLWLIEDEALYDELSVSIFTD